MLVMLNPKISVIIPIYNVSDYLRPCLDSLINQSLKEIEIILVNDCSPDPMDEQICLEYKNQDPRILYIRHDQNLGPGGARNTGIRYATAPYLAFVDGDDIVHVDMYQKCLTALEEGDYDLVQCNCEKVSLSGSFLSKLLQLEKPKKLENSDILNALVDYKSGIFMGPWNKVWKKDVFLDNDLLFPEHIYNQDMFVTCVYMIYVHKVLLLPEVYYYWRQRPESITNHITEKNIYSYFKVLSLIKEAFLNKANHLDWLGFYNTMYRTGLVYCVNRAYGQKETQLAFVSEMKNEMLFQHLNYFQLRFVINYMYGPAEKRLWLLLSEILELLGIREPLKKRLKKLAFHKK